MTGDFKEVYVKRKDCLWGTHPKTQRPVSARRVLQAWPVWHEEYTLYFRDITTISLSTTSWHLTRALPMTEQQRHLPSVSMETESYADIAVSLQ